MAQVRYYRVTDPELQKKIEDFDQRMGEVIKLRGKIARELGCSRKAASVIHGYGYFWAIGKFQEEPDTKLWRQDKHGNWVPRRGNKAGRAIADKMYTPETVLPGGRTLAELLGYNPYNDGETRGGQLVFSHPGMVLFHRGNRKVWVVKIPSKFVPKGCKRISDIQFEQYEADELSREKAARRKKK